MSVCDYPRHFRPNPTSVHQIIYVTTLTVLLHPQLSMPAIDQMFYVATLAVLRHPQLSMPAIDQMFYIATLAVLRHPQLSMPAIDQMFYVTILTVLRHPQLSMPAIDQMFYVTILTVLRHPQLSMPAIDQMFYVVTLTVLLHSQLSMRGYRSNVLCHRSHSFLIYPEIFDPQTCRTIKSHTANPFVMSSSYILLDRPIHSTYSPSSPASIPNSSNTILFKRSLLPIIIITGITLSLSSHSPLSHPAHNRCGNPHPQQHP
jgi:hypothetical protein